MLTPLNSILNLTQYLQSKLGASSTSASSLTLGVKQSNSQGPQVAPETAKYFSIIYNSAKILHYYVLSLLDLQMIYKQNFTFYESEFSPSSSCEEVMRLIKVQANEKALNIFFEEDSSSCPQIIYSDQRRYQQVLLCILQNAVKYTYSGQISIS